MRARAERNRSRDRHLRQQPTAMQAGRAAVERRWRLHRQHQLGVRCNVLNDNDQFNGQRFETAQDISRYIRHHFCTRLWQCGGLSVVSSCDVNTVGHRMHCVESQRQKQRPAFCNCTRYLQIYLDVIFALDCGSYTHAAEHKPCHRPLHINDR